jgi:hypothetical protein
MLQGAKSKQLLPQKIALTSSTESMLLGKTTDLFKISPYQTVVCFRSDSNVFHVQPFVQG